MIFEEKKWWDGAEFCWCQPGILDRDSRTLSKEPKRQSNLKISSLAPIGVEDLYWSFQINSRLRQNVKKQYFCAFTGDNCLEAGLRRDAIGEIIGKILGKI